MSVNFPTSKFIKIRSAVRTCRQADMGTLFGAFLELRCEGDQKGTNKDGEEIIKRGEERKG
jgi:hypothetical protein